MALETQVGEDFPEDAQRVLDALYAGQKNGAPKNDREKIILLNSLIGPGTYIPPSENIAETRRTYEFAYLTRISVL